MKRLTCAKCGPPVLHQVTGGDLQSVLQTVDGIYVAVLQCQMNTLENSSLN